MVGFMAVRMRNLMLYVDGSVFVQQLHRNVLLVMLPLFGVEGSYVRLYVSCIPCAGGCSPAKTSKCALVDDIDTLFLINIIQRTMISTTLTTTIIRRDHMRTFEEPLIFHSFVNYYKTRG